MTLRGWINGENSERKFYGPRNVSSKMFSIVELMIQIHFDSVWTTDFSFREYFWKRKSESLVYITQIMNWLDKIQI